MTDEKKAEPSKVDDDAIQTLRNLGISLALGGPLTAWSGFVTMKVWNWFISPISGLRNIGLAEGIGVRLVGSVLTNSAPPQIKREYLRRPNAWYDASLRIAFGALTLLIGALVKKELPKSEER